MAVCSKETLIRIEELPLINGVRIESIYAKKRDEIYYSIRDSHDMKLLIFIY